MPLALFCAHFLHLPFSDYAVFLYSCIFLTMVFFIINCDNTPMFIELIKRSQAVGVTLCYQTHLVIPATNIDLGLLSRTELSMVVKNTGHTIIKLDFSNVLRITTRITFIYSVLFTFSLNVSDSFLTCHEIEA